jgi:hypothetical protein
MTAVCYVAEMPESERHRGRPTTREQVRRVRRYNTQVTRAMLTGRQPRKRARVKPPTGTELAAAERERRREGARRSARYMRACGMTLDQIARSDLMERWLGKKVSPVRIKQLLSSGPTSPRAWEEDTERAMREWTRHLDSTNDPEDRRFWDEIVFPRLWARPGLNEPSWATERLTYVIRGGKVVERGKTPIPDSELALLPPSGRIRDWRLDIRNRIICHLFFKDATQPVSESGKVVKRLAGNFRVGPQTICRILLAYQKSRRRTRSRASNGATQADREVDPVDPYGSA